MSTDRPREQHARLALAAYLRLLAACLEDEAELLETDPDRGVDVLRRFREGVLAMSLQDAPLDTLIAGGIAEPAPAATIAVPGRSVRAAAAAGPAPKRRR
jgi:hypothetical protein